MSPEEIAKEIGKFLLLVVGVVAAVIVLAIYAWHHFRFVS